MLAYFLLLLFLFVVYIIYLCFAPIYKHNNISQNNIQHDKNYNEWQESKYVQCNLIDKNTKCQIICICLGKTVNVEFNNLTQSAISFLSSNASFDNTTFNSLNNLIVYPQTTVITKIKPLSSGVYSLFFNNKQRIIIWVEDTITESRLSLPEAKLIVLSDYNNYYKYFIPNNRVRIYNISKRTYTLTANPTNSSTKISDNKEIIQIGGDRDILAKTIKREEIYLLPEQRTDIMFNADLYIISTTSSINIFTNNEPINIITQLKVLPDIIPKTTLRIRYSSLNKNQLIVLNSNTLIHLINDTDKNKIILFSSPCQLVNNNSYNNLDDKSVMKYNLDNKISIDTEYRDSIRVLAMTEKKVIIKQGKIWITLL